MKIKEFVKLIKLTVTKGFPVLTKEGIRSTILRDIEKFEKQLQNKIIIILDKEEGEIYQKHYDGSEAAKELFKLTGLETKYFDLVEKIKNQIKSQLEDKK